MRYRYFGLGVAAIAIAIASQPVVAAPPEFAPVGPVTWVSQNNPASFNLDVHDPDSDPVVVTATGLPPGLQISVTSDYWAMTEHSKNALRPQDLAINASGDVIFSTYRTAFTGGGLRKIDGSWWIPRGNNTDGPLSSSSTYTARGLERAADGTVYFTDHQGGLRKVANQVVSTLAAPSGLFPTNYTATDVTMDNGDPVVAYSAGVVRYNASGGVSILADDSAIAGGLGYLIGIESDGSGGFYLASNRRQILHLDANGQVTVFAGQLNGVISSATPALDGPNTTATFYNSINQMTLAPDGSLFVANHDSVRIISNGVTRTVSRRNGAPLTFSAADGIVREPSGTFLVSDRHTSKIMQLHPQGWQITGSYSGPNCGGVFNATITATDFNGETTTTLRKFSVAPVGPGCGGPPPGPGGATTGTGTGTSPVITPGGTLTRPGSQPSNNQRDEEEEVSRERAPRETAPKRDERR